CDDGNAISRDGCDSRGNAEQTAWTLTYEAPHIQSVGLSAFDPVQQRFVHVTSAGVLWTWDGVTWTATQPTTHYGTGDAPAGLVFDPDRQRLVLLVQHETLDMYEWVAGAWQLRETTNQPTSNGVLELAYDSSRHLVVVVSSSSSSGWTLDASGVWHAM